MPTNFDDRMERAYYRAHSGCLSPQLLFSRFLTSSVSYDLRSCDTTKPTFDRKYWRQEAAFGCKYGGDAKIHILHAGKAHIGCHPQDMHMHASELKSGRLQTCIHMPQNCAAAAALVTGHTHMVELRAWRGVVFVATLTAGKCHIGLCFRLQQLARAQSDAEQAFFHH